MVKIGINGFGRIGRMTLRIALKHPDADVVSLNDPFVNGEYIAYQFKHDSVHGKYDGIVTYREDGYLIIDGKKIKIHSYKDPSSIPWKEDNIDVVVESSGVYTTLDRAELHIANCKTLKVIVTTPSSDAPTFVIGVNDDQYTRDVSVVSCGSCSVNCASVLLKVISDYFGVSECFITTIQSATASQKVVDATSSKDWRGGRGILNNIIPCNKTNTSQGVEKVLPSLSSKLTSMSFRVPTADVSVADLTIRLDKPAIKEDIDMAMQNASQKGNLRGILAFCDEECVSSDFLGDAHSAVYDSKSTTCLSDRSIKVVGWYDNEISYSTRVVELAVHIHKCS